MKKDQNKKIKLQLLKAADSVRQKYKALKLSTSLNEEYLQKIFQPVIAPIEALSTKIHAKPYQQQQQSKKRKGNKIQIPKIKKEKKEEEADYIEMDRKKADDYDDDDDDDDADGDGDGDNEGDDASRDDRTKTEFFDVGDISVNRYPAIARDAMRDVITKQSDTTYGPLYDESLNKLYMGKYELKIDRDGNLTINNKKFLGTKGLYDLLFSKKPKEIVTTKDLDAYKSILEISNTHRRNNDSSQQLKGTKSDKYQSIISPLFTSPPTSHSSHPSRASSFKGKGLYNKKPIEYVYWDDVNELVSRLGLLHASKQAGNTSHLNEILSIVEELREGGYIY